MDRDKLLEKLEELRRKLVDKLVKADSEQARLISGIINHIAGIESSLRRTTEEDMALSNEREKIYEIVEEFVKLREGIEQGRYRHFRVSDILKILPETSYPYVLPDTLFGHGAAESIDVSVGRRSFSESLALSIRLIYPGSLSWRYGSLSWFPVEHWSRRLVQFSEHGCERVADIELNSLPEVLQRSLFAYERIPIYRPKTINLRTIAFERRFVGTERIGFAVCPMCGGLSLDIAGDRQRLINRCACGVGREHKRNPPSDYPLIHKIVEFKSPVSPSKPPDPTFSALFDRIEFSNNVGVTEFVYGIQRVFEDRIFQKFYDGKFYGDVYETDGVCFKVNEDFVRLLFDSISSSPNILRDFALLFYLDAIIQQFSATVSPWFLIQVLTSCLAAISGPNSLTTSKNVVESFQTLNDYKEDIIGVLRQVRDEDLSEEQMQAIDEILEYLHALNFAKEEFMNHVKKLFLHSLAHSIKISSVLTLGVSEYELGYFYDENLNQIIIFDTSKGGNGCSETLYYKVLSIGLRQRLKDIYDLWDTKLEKTRDERKVFAEYVPLPSRDFFSYLEENMVSCVSAVSSSILYLYLNDILDSLEKGLTSKQMFDQLKSNIGYLSERVAHNMFAKLQNAEYFQVYRRVQDYGDFFIYRFSPWILFQRLTNADRIEIFANYNGSEDSEKRVESIVKSACNICVDGCPACILFEGCEISFLSQFYISRRLLNSAYQLCTSDFILRIDEERLNEKIQLALDVLSRRGVIILRSYSLDLLLRCAANLVSRDTAKGKVCLKGIFSGIEGDKGYLELKLVAADFSGLGRLEEEHPMVFDTFLILAELLKAKYGDPASCKIHIIAPWIQDVIFYNGVMGVSSNLDLDIFPKDSVRLLEILSYVKSKGGDVKVLALHPKSSNWPIYACDFLVSLAERGIEVYLDVKEPYKTHKKFLITSYGVSEGSRNFTNVSYYYRDDHAPFWQIGTEKFEKVCSILERSTAQKEYIEKFSLEELRKLRETL